MGVNLITVLGPTATGKTKLAARLAYHFVGEIISADSRQVYTGMDIGTGKDLADYIINGETVNHHMVDILPPEGEFNVYMFKTLFFKYFNDIISRNRLPFLVGGTGLYISAVIQNYQIKKADFSYEKISQLEKLSDEELTKLLLKLNPKQHNTTDLVNRSRMIKAIIVERAKSDSIEENLSDVSSLVIGIRLPREKVRERITGRLKQRLENGMLEEVERLLTSGVSFKRLMEFGLEYKYAALYLNNELSYEEMFVKLNTAIHQFSKRQMTWFRKMEKEGVKIHWLDEPHYEQAKDLISSNI